MFATVKEIVKLFYPWILAAFFALLWVSCLVRGQKVVYKMIRVTEKVVEVEECKPCICKIPSSRPSKSILDPVTKKIAKMEKYFEQRKKAEENLLFTCQEKVRDLAFSEDNHLLAVACGGEIRLFHAEIMKEFAKFTLLEALQVLNPKGFEDEKPWMQIQHFTKVVFAKSDSLLLAGTNKGSVLAYDLKTLKLLYGFVTRRGIEISGLRLHTRKPLLYAVSSGMYFFSYRIDLKAKTIGKKLQLSWKRSIDEGLIIYKNEDQPIAVSVEHDEDESETKLYLETLSSKKPTKKVPAQKYVGKVEIAAVNDTGLILLSSGKKIEFVGLDSKTQFQVFVKETLEKVVAGSDGFRALTDDGKMVRYAEYKGKIVSLEEVKVCPDTNYESAFAVDSNFAACSYEKKVYLKNVLPK